MLTLYLTSYTFVLYVYVLLFKTRYLRILSEFGYELIFYYCISVIRSFLEYMKKNMCAPHLCSQEGILLMTQLAFFSF